MPVRISARTGYGYRRSRRRLRTVGGHFIMPVSRHPGAHATRSLDNTGMLVLRLRLRTLFLF
jgi:hypothetical protein